MDVRSLTPFIIGLQRLEMIYSHLISPFIIHFG